MFAVIICTLVCSSHWPIDVLLVELITFTISSSSSKSSSSSSSELELSDEESMSVCHHKHMYKAKIGFSWYCRVGLGNIAILSPLRNIRNIAKIFTFQ